VPIDKSSVCVNIRRRDLVLLSLWLMPRHRSSYITWVVLALLIAAFLMYRHGIPETPYSAGVLVLASVLGGLGGIVIGCLLSLAQILVASRQSNGVLGKHTYTLRDDGLHEITEANETLAKWAGLRDVRRTPSYIYVETAPALFHVLPRRDFQSHEAFDDFWTALKAGIHGKPGVSPQGAA
jgi:hypothetical protein